MATPSIQIPENRLTSLKTLLREYGPFRRDQLRLKLARAAVQCRDEADHLTRSNARFQCISRPSRSAGPTSETLLTEAEVLDAMVAFVSDFQPDRALTASN